MCKYSRLLAALAACLMIGLVGCAPSGQESAPSGQGSTPLAATENCSEAWCREQYGAAMQATEGRVVGPDGPEIILEPVGNSLQWKVGGTPVIEGNGATIVPGDISTCVLRDDFIGQKKLHFKYIKQGEAGSRLAKVVVLENDDYRLEIRENSLKQLQWTLKDKANSTACVLTPSGQFAYPVKLPEPLMSFTTSDGFNEVQYNHPIATLTLQGQMPPL